MIIIIEMKKIDCFIPFADKVQVSATIKSLEAEPLVNKICMVGTDGCDVNLVDSLTSTATIRNISNVATAPYILLFTKYTTLSFVHYGLQRMLDVLIDSQGVMAYADHFNKSGDMITTAPVLDYQFGSLRDDFDFGSLLLFRTDDFKTAVSRMDTEYKAAGLYDLRLKLSQKGSFTHINEFIYYDVELDNRKSGEKLFDYVNPKNRSVQIEMEQVCTQHLKDIGGWLAPQFKHIDFSKDTDFEYDASVVIPCRNRVKTIGDAIRSALSQKSKYRYNVIVVDDNSTDGTVDVIKSFDDERLVYIAQDRTWHGIGGNWNSAFQ